MGILLQKLVSFPLKLTFKNKCSITEIKFINKLNWLRISDYVGRVVISSIAVYNIR